MTAPESKTDAVSINEIGWLFVKNYYGTYTTELQNLYGFYDKNASLLHDGFPVESAESETPVTKTVHLANGTESIKSHFADQSGSSEKNKIVIERADFQSSVENSILIVVCGSWKRGSSSLWQFVQTFVLKPVGTNSYDVANDMLKFVDLSESFEQPSVVIQQPSTPAPNGNTEIPAAEAPEVESKKDEAVKEEPVVEKKKAEEPAAETKAPKVPKEEKPKKVEEEVKAEEKKEATPAEAEPAAPAVPAVKPTWANLAAMQPKVPSSKTATVASPGAAKNVPAPSPTVVKAGSPAQASAQQPQQPQHTNPKNKKEDWYPIYIRDADVEEEALRSALTKTFGEMKFFKKNQRVALCDFKEKEFQQRALEAKEILVGNTVVHIEPRTHKQNNNKKDFKDKKAMKKNNNNGAGKKN